MRRVIGDSELGVVCDNARCTGQATYVIVVHFNSEVVRLYCTDCKHRLVKGALKILRRNGIDADKLDEYVTTELLMTGATVNA